MFLLGLIALCEEEIFSGLEVHIPYADKFRDTLKLPASKYPHITTSHLWRDRYEELLVPTFKNQIWVVDIYHKDWSELRGRKTQGQRKNSQVFVQGQIHAGGKKNTQVAGQGLSQAGGGKNT